MKVAIPKERRANERRVAASPDTIKKYKQLGLDVVVETGAGKEASIPDQAFADAGATIAPDEASALSDADIVLKVQRPLTEAEGGPDELALMKPGAMLVAILQPYQQREQIQAYANAKVNAFAMELMPRITRAQSMDVLSSQANLAGYRAVVDAAVGIRPRLPDDDDRRRHRAAGPRPDHGRRRRRPPGHRHGKASRRRRVRDRRAAGHQGAGQSLGATFVAVEDEEFKEAQTAGGYAKEMSPAYQEKQRALIAETIKKQDIVITTALIPGRKAPILVTDAMVRSMKPGSVLVDLAVEQGGNVEGSKPGEVVDIDGVKIVGHLNVPSRNAIDASMLYSKNLLNFLTPLIDKEKGLTINWDDEIIKGTALTRDGALVHPNFAAAEPVAAKS